LGTPEKFLHGALFVEVGVAVEGHLLHQVCQAKSKVLNLLTGLKGEAFPLAAEPLQRGVTDALTTETPGGDRLPGELGRRLVGEGGAEICRHRSAQSLQGPAIILVDDVAVGDGLPEPARLELHLHEKAPLVVVGAGEHGPPAADVAVDLHHRRPTTSSVAPIWGRREVSTALRSVETLRPIDRRLAILDLLAQGGGCGYGSLSRLCRLGCCLCFLRGRCFCGGKTGLPCLVFTVARSGDVLALCCCGGGGALAGGGHGCGDG